MGKSIYKWMRTGGTPMDWKPLYQAYHANSYSLHYIYALADLFLQLKQSTERHDQARGPGVAREN